MSAIVLTLAAALLMVPTRGAVGRLRSALPPRSGGTPPRPPVWRRLSPFDAAFVACVPVAVIGAIGPAFAVVVVVATVRRRHRRGAAARSRDRERAQVLAGLEAVIGELGVGAHPAVACDAAAQDCHGDASTALRTAAGRARLGGSAAGGLSLPGSVVADELSRLAEAWSVAESRGLPLAELLQAARSDLQGRSRFRSRADAGLAGARATGAVLAGLPVLGIGLGQLMGAAPVRVLAGGGLGSALLVAGTVLVALGLAWTDRIVDRAVP
ncbi:type II secretion system protein F (GspF) [Rhodococcus sp. OK519]|uniref:type II secretion system F family protein n=1 Tax=Rhodococcus sp. OK519 TaxID=2135729 RepID=UPI000D471B36|nr:type II secretion system protein F (GspF) [Rhodococcus sp. OK519]